MCGLFGAVAHSCVVRLLLGGLEALEYRGYDSCGIAVLNKGIQIKKSDRKVAHLSRLALTDKGFCGNSGMAHTRWATHGAPSVSNAHPIHTGRLAVAHNGVIENHATIRAALEVKGYKFHTETDTEVIPHLVDSFLRLGLPPQEAVHNALQDTQGNFAIIAIFEKYENLLVAANKGLPLVLGRGAGASFISSDEYALNKYAEEVSYLQDNHIAEVSRDGITVYAQDRRPFRGSFFFSPPKEIKVDKGAYQHFMLKEIHEQPKILQDTVEQFLNEQNCTAKFACNQNVFKTRRHLTIIGCGSSYIAGLIAKCWIESITDIKVYLNFASEFRYSHARICKDEVLLFISQSGETADTLAALRHAKKQKGIILSLTNVPRNSIERESDVSFKTLAGQEIGVASTKTFSTQLAVLACFALWLSQIREPVTTANNAQLFYALKLIPSHVSYALQASVETVADIIMCYNRAVIMGRGTCYGAAMEAALKIRELSYIHTIGIATGEMKHGSIALVDASLPVIAMVPYDEMFKKNLISVQEVSARGGIILAFTDQKGAPHLQHICHTVIELPETNFFSSPIAYTVSMQLLAYTIAIKKGLDADRPRNLAKSVTVE